MSRLGDLARRRCTAAWGRARRTLAALARRVPAYPEDVLVGHRGDVITRRSDAPADADGARGIAGARPPPPAGARRD